MGGGGVSKLSRSSHLNDISQETIDLFPPEENVSKRGKGRGPSPWQMKSVEICGLNKESDGGICFASALHLAIDPRAQACINK